MKTTRWTWGLPYVKQRELALKIAHFGDNQKEIETVGNILMDNINIIL